MAHIPHSWEFSSQLWYAAGQFQYLKVDSIEIRITNESVKIYFWYLKGIKTRYSMNMTEASNAKSQFPRFYKNYV